MYTLCYYLFLSTTQLIQLLNSDELKEPKKSSVFNEMDISILVGTLLYRNQSDVSSVALTLAALPMGGDS